MINPGSASLTVYTGGTFSQEFDFWDDTAETVAHDFTGWTLSLTFSFLLPVGTPNVNATVNVTSNAVVCTLTPSQTAAMPTGAAHFVLSMANNTTGEVEYLLNGTATVKAP